MSVVQVQDCLAAICQYRESQSTQDAPNTGPGEETSDRLSNEIIGDKVAFSLAESACAYLSQNELTQFIDFFLHHQPETSDEMAQRFNELRQEFYSLEIQESSEPLNRLAQPSGPLGASLGLIMHCQTKKGPACPSWDMKSPTIQALATKGVSDAFMFGFDWHWRAEESPMGRGSCPTTSRKKSVESLHDEFSADVLAPLPLPFNTVFGECARKHYERAPIRGQRRLLTLPVFPGTNLAFALHFNAGKMKRMTVYY